MDFLVPSLLPPDLTVEAGASWQCVQGLEPWNEDLPSPLRRVF